METIKLHKWDSAEHLKTEIQDRLEQAGVQVMEARISHLAYAPEIAHAMLQRQQASRPRRTLRCICKPALTKPATTRRLLPRRWAPSHAPKA